MTNPKLAATTKAEAIFRSIDADGDGTISKGELVACLAKSGIGISDARLAALRQRLAAMGDKPLPPQAFGELMEDSGELVSRAARGDLAIPEFGRFAEEIAGLHDEVSGQRDGQVADYIPQLARVSEEAFGVSITTVDGQSYSVGESHVGFTLQSSCKPFLYAAALEEWGEASVHRHVGREPSGLSFNELTLNKDGLPHNPMINAGAIMTSSLIRRAAPTADRIEFLTDLVSAMAGGQRCHVNTAIWHSERETADRNFALAHHMRERGAFLPDTQIQATLDYYFSACSIEINTEAMAMIGSTLANGGVCPTTGVRVFKEETVKNCLSMMYSCGMYDYSGEFAFSVGIPAKSAVSGVILAVIPNVMGIAVWSPRLDACGNSVRGVAFLKELVGRFAFHNYDSLLSTSKTDPRRFRSADEYDRTCRAIHAASIGDIEDLKRLVAHGHDLNRADYDGRTPLHLAASEGQVDTVRYLIRQGVATSSLDRWGHTALDDARRHIREEVGQLLSSRAQGETVEVMGRLTTAA